MSSNAHLNISPKFRVAEGDGPLGHPMRGVKRQHLLRREDNDPARERRILIRDTMISVMGAVSAMVPMFIALQSVVGV